MRAEQHTLGLAEHLVGVTDECDWPPQARTVQVVSRSALPAVAEPAEIDRLVGASINGGHRVPEMLQVAGAEAVLACPGAPSVRVTWAQIAAAAPQVVVFMPCGYDLRAAVEEATRTLLGRRELAGVEAIVAVDVSAYCSRPGPRLVDDVEIPGRGAPPRTASPASSGHRRATRAKTAPVKPS